MNKMLALSINALLCFSSSVALSAPPKHAHSVLSTPNPTGIPIPIRQPFQEPDEAGAGAISLIVAPKVFTYNDKDYAFRTYNGKLVGPTMRIAPGQTLNVNLTNNLSSKFSKDEKTNLHTHGLHASPKAPQDNPLAVIQPNGGTSGDYYHILVPTNQWTGTQWYHPHWHGNTAIQVANGMTGALIVEDDPAKLPQSLKDAKEKIFVFQQIQVNDAIGQPLRARITASGKAVSTDSIPVLINGQSQPVLTMQPGEVQRWRFIDGDGSFHQLNLVLEGHDLNEIALDGMYTGTIDTWKAATQIGQPSQAVVLNSGNRSDVLIQAQACGKAECSYKLIDLATADDETDQILATLVVKGDAKPMTLPTTADMATLKSQVDIPTTDAPATQTATLMVGADVCNEGTDCVDGVTWNKAEPPRPMPIGEVQKWKVSTNKFSHPFHIHVNPFQTTRSGPDGNPETVWLDTALVSPDKPVELYIRNEDVLGAPLADGVSVLHCHILAHEDAGMMQSIEFKAPSVK